MELQQNLIDMQIDKFIDLQKLDRQIDKFTGTIQIA